MKMEEQNSKKNCQTLFADALLAIQEVPKVKTMETRLCLAGAVTGWTIMLMTAVLHIYLDVKNI